MTTRMEKVAEDVALAVLPKASTAAAPSLQPEKLQESFRATWPTGDSRLPINDAMNAVVDAGPPTPMSRTGRPGRPGWKRLGARQS